MTAKRGRPSTGQAVLVRLDPADLAWADSQPEGRPAIIREAVRALRDYRELEPVTTAPELSAIAF